VRRAAAASVAYDGAPVDDSTVAKFRAAMDDDFNTPEAIAVLFELTNELNRARDPQHARLLKSLGGILGLLQRDPVAFLQGAVTGEGSATAQPAQARGTGSVRHTPEWIEKLIAARAAARKTKKFAEADRIRQELLDAGIVLEDGPQGTTWRRS
jgi:cysteinyl-tRNA synthetase